MLAIGTQAPDFSLFDQDNKSHSLSYHKNQSVLVYFYPKDDTAGCTKEACAIRDAYGEFEKKGVKVFGISTDSVESHKKFAEKYNLPFTLLSDPRREVITVYGAQKDNGGTSRISYLVKDGIVVKTYPNVDPATHAEEILKSVE